MHTTNEVFKRPPGLDKRVGVVKVKSAEEQVEMEEEEKEMSRNWVGRLGDGFFIIVAIVYFK